MGVSELESGDPANHCVVPLILSVEENTLHEDAGAEVVEVSDELEEDVWVVPGELFGVELSQLAQSAHARPITINWMGFFIPRTPYLY